MLWLESWAGFLVFITGYASDEEYATIAYPLC